MPGKSATSEEIKRACDKFFESWGERKVTYREMMDKHALRGMEKRRRPTRDERIEKMAQEIEQESQQ